MISNDDLFPSTQTFYGVSDSRMIVDGDSVWAADDGGYALVIDVIYLGLHIIFESYPTDFTGSESDAIAIEQFRIFFLSGAVIVHRKDASVLFLSLGFGGV